MMDHMKEEGFPDEKIVHPPQARRNRLLAGCAIGCCALVVLSFLGCGGLFYYMTRPGKSLNELALLSKESCLFVRIRLNFKDDGIRALAGRYIARLKKKDFKTVDQPIRNWLAWMEEQPGRTVEMLREWASLQVVLVGEPGSEKLLDWFAVLNFEKAPRTWGPFLFALAAQDASKKNPTVKYREQLILRVKNPDWGKGRQGIAMIDNNLIIGSTLEKTKQAIDRVLLAQKGPVQFPGTEPMKQTIKASLPDGDAILAFTNEANLLGPLLAKLKEPDSPIGFLEGMETVLGLPAGEIERISVDIDLESEHKMTASLSFWGMNAAKARSVRDSLDLILTALVNSEGVVRSGLVLEHAVHSNGNRITVDMKVNRVWDWIDESLARKEQRRKERAAQVQKKPPGKDTPNQAPEIKKNQKPPEPSIKPRTPL